MKTIAAILFAFTLAACSSPPKTADIPIAATPVASTLTTGFTGTGIKLTFDKAGQWERITSTSTTTVMSNVLGAGDEAITVATMKARRQIAEFITTEISSKRTLNTISDTVKKSDVAGESQDDVRIAQAVKDSITQSSHAILRGSVVESEYLDAEKVRATVVVAVDRRTAQASAAMLGQK